MGHFSQNFRSPLAAKLLVGLKNSRGCNNPPSLCKVWWRSAAEQRREKQKLNVFVIFCYFLLFFVCLALDLEQRLSHSNSDVVAICKSILMWISAFFSGRNKHLRDIRTMPQGGATFVLELGQNLNFSVKFERQSLCARLRPFRRRIEKIHQQPINSTVIVDVHLYKIFRILDFVAAL